MQVNQRIHRKGGGRLVLRTEASLHFTDVGTYFGGSYWKVHQLAGFELRRVGPDGKVGAGRAHQPEAQLLPARPRADPPRPALAQRPRTTPAATRTPTPSAVTLGTSVGWSDIYPADYDKQWINVSGLRGCFAFTMTVDPKELLFESNEHDNTSRRLVRLPYRGQPGC